MGTIITYIDQWGNELNWALDGKVIKVEEEEPYRDKVKATLTLDGEIKRIEPLEVDGMSISFPDEMFIQWAFLDLDYLDGSNTKEPIFVLFTRNKKNILYRAAYVYRDWEATYFSVLEDLRTLNVLEFIKLGYLPYMKETTLDQLGIEGVYSVEDIANALLKALFIDESLSL